jgi:hypothetical protein
LIIKPFSSLFWAQRTRRRREEARVRAENRRKFIEALRLVTDRDYTDVWGRSLLQQNDKQLVINRELAEEANIVDRPNVLTNSFVGDDKVYLLRNVPPEEYLKFAPSYQFTPDEDLNFSSVVQSFYKKKPSAMQFAGIIP